MHDVVLDSHAHTERRLTYLFSHTHTDHSRIERPDIELAVSIDRADARVFTIRLNSKLAVSCDAANCCVAAERGYIDENVGFVAFQICFDKHFQAD